MSDSELEDLIGITLSGEVEPIVIDLAIMDALRDDDLLLYGLITAEIEDDNVNQDN